MSRKLEEFMQENKAAFDMHEPSPKVWNEIWKESKPTKKLNLSWVKYVAALLIFAVGFSTGSFYKKNSETSFLLKLNQQKRLENSKLLESEYYYSTQITDCMKKLEPYFASDPQLKDDIQVDFDDLDEFYKKLETDLSDDVNNEYVIEAMIQSYQSKLEILESLLEQLNGYDTEDKSYDI